MSVILDILSWAALLAGGFFAIVGMAGLHRMPDLFTRMHAGSVSDTLGMALLTLGMLLQTEDWAIGVRLVIILLLVWIAGAVVTHALARAALHDGERPLLADREGHLSPIGPARIDPELAARLTTRPEQFGAEGEPAAQDDSGGQAWNS